MLGRSKKDKSKMSEEQKHKEDLEAAKGWLAIAKENNNTIAIQILENLFPELRESEDERIRKTFLRYVKNWQQGYCSWNSDKDFCNDAIAWLEKQGEQKPSDKVEPKFKVGNWITNGEYTWKVTAIRPLDYILQSPNGDVVDDAISYVDEHFHLWTIQDAKDGDVLVYEGEIFMIKSYVLWHKIVYHCCYDGKNLHKHSIYDSWRKEDFDKVHPATKEQREFLFQNKEQIEELDELIRKLKNNGIIQFRYLAQK